MKDIRAQAKSGMAAKLSRMGGNRGDIGRVMKGMPARDGEPKGYATGGAVDAGPVDGAPAKPNLARAGRKMGKGKKADGKGPTVNVIVAGGGGPKPPMAGPPPDMPMPPPPGPGGPPMPMRKHGGAVAKFAKGGRVKRADGGSATGEKDLSGSGTGPRSSDNDEYTPNQRRLGVKGYADRAAGGKQSTSEADEDDAKSGRWIPKLGGAGGGGSKKSGGRINRMAGGRVPLDAGAGGGEGRQEKAKAYGSKPGKAV